MKTLKEFLLKTVEGVKVLDRDASQAHTQFAEDARIAGDDASAEVHELVVELNERLKGIGEPVIEDLQIEGLPREMSEQAFKFLISEFYGSEGYHFVGEESFGDVYADSNEDNG